MDYFQLYDIPLSLKVDKTEFSNFCEDFIIPVQSWKKLETYCQSSKPYLCSTEIQSYPRRLNELGKMLVELVPKEVEIDLKCLQ